MIMSMSHYYGHVTILRVCPIIQDMSHYEGVFTLLQGQNINNNNQCIFQVGRYLVATRDIEPLELIIEDEPAVFGPNHDTGPACMECLLPTDGSFLCPKCSLPLCGPDCLDGPYHKPECEVFSKPLPTGFEFRVELNREM